MNSKALYAVMLALLLPLVSYFIVKRYSDKATIMPPHYYADSVISNTKNGKQFTDTIWHRVADFSMTNQLGKQVSWDSLKGKIVVADFFFTHCPTICVPMAKNMKRLQESITNAQKVGDTTNPYIQFLSFSIDPQRDSVSRLKYWADRFQINPEKWWLLTGDKKKVYDLALNEMKLGMVDGEEVDTNYAHSDKFVLIDSSRIIRGYYSGLDSADLANLSKDIVLLTMEKNPKAKGFLAGQLQLIIVVFLIAMVGVGIFLFLFRKKSK
ncbi:MAG TPA: SCO family protein [Chitinophagaceae bacterium]|nr:SCO family protein [Chitinophagaceae bacterium]